jgi:hypothetical protein
MTETNVCLIRWEDGAPRLLGRTADPVAVEAVRAALAAERRRELARVDRPVRLVESDEPQEPSGDAS